MPSCGRVPHRADQQVHTLPAVMAQPDSCSRCSYGRMMISAQMNTHERLVTNATARTENNVSEVQ